MSSKVPQSLRIWFLIHFFVDIIFAIPLLLIPSWILGRLSIVTTETITARLVGAALMGIGGASFFSYKKSKESYDILLTLKIIWSVTALIALALSLYAGAQNILWLIIGIFAIFSAVWIYYKIKLRN